MCIICRKETGLKKRQNFQDNLYEEQAGAILREDVALVEPLVKTTKGFYIFVGILLFFVFLGVVAYLTQFWFGLGVTGLNRPVYWAFYITNFVFFIGISHAGTLISAILRVAQAEWRRAITRSAEVITVMVIFIGLGNILVDMGRPDRLLNLLLHGQVNSPLLWDVISVSCYLTASTTYLYLPLIPDIAILRDTVKKRKWFYTVLALGWKGTQRQHKILETLIGILAVVVIPVAVSVHTVISFIFAMTIQPMWHSAIFGPYFVVGAIFSGIAALIIAMFILRKVYRLEAYFKEIHFNYLGILLLVMTCAWFYFTLAEFLTTFYGSEPHEMEVFWEKLTGRYAIGFWIMVLTNFVIPMVILSRPKTRTALGTLIASCSIVIGMWLERFLIILPTLVNPMLPYPRGNYFPSWVEICITLGFLSLFILFYTIFTKFFPIISIWEIKEGREKAVFEVEERVKSYLPDPQTAEK